MTSPDWTTCLQGTEQAALFRRAKLGRLQHRSRASLNQTTAQYGTRSVLGRKYALGPFILQFRGRSGYEINLIQRQAIEVALGYTSTSRLWPAQRLELYGHNRTANNGSVGC